LTCDPTTNGFQLTESYVLGARVENCREEWGVDFRAMVVSLGAGPSAKASRPTHRDKAAMNGAQPPHPKVYIQNR
jgi:hypothetical protein